MPDVATMKAMEMREELESYGINTKTMFDKRDFEKALLDARRDYEQTIKDCMHSAQAYTEKEKKKKTTAKKKTVNYDRTNPDHFHEREQMWNMDSDYRHADPDVVGPNRHRPGGGTHPYDDPYAYGGGRGRGHMGVEEDPLFAHEAQYAYGGGVRPGPGPGPRGGPRPGPRRRYYRPQDAPPPPPPPHGGAAGPAGPTGGTRREPHPQYSDPAMQMRYHQALDRSYVMKVDELQRELNERGISTKYCFVFADFCVAYAKAVAEDKPKTKRVDDPFDGDADYDPSYRDVVMERYDPTKIL
jgi:hypothetical protein